MIRSAVLCLSVCLAAAATRVPGQDEQPFHPEWLEKDCALARAVRALGEVPPEEVVECLAALGGKVDDLDREVGFGGRQVKLVRYGGYTSCWFTVLSYKGEIADLTVFQDCDQEREARQWKALAAVWGDAATADARGFHLARRRDDVLARYRAAVEAQLGAPPKVELPDALTPALATLMDPREVYDWGTECYYAGVPPRGREAAAALFAAGDPAPFRAALRGLNPEGRVYAAEALLRLAHQGTPLSEEDRDTIAILRGLSLPIGTCRGCFVIPSTAALVLAQVEKELDG